LSPRGFILLHKEEYYEEARKAMTKPSTHTSTLSFREPAHQALKPSLSGIDQKDQETCINLPFALVFESLTYVGIVSRETWQVRPHYHDHFELCYVDEGEGWFAIDDFAYAVKKGDLFLTKPWEIHHGTARGDTPYRLYYLGFELDTMSHLETDYYQLGIHRVCPDPQETIRHAFHEMFTELQQGQMHAREMIQSLFLRLLVSALRLYEQIGQMEDRRHALLSPIIREVLNYIHAARGSEDTIDTLAEKVHLSHSHLAREFQRCMGVSLGHYMRTVCLQWSKLYLRETAASISQIAERLHFPSIHTFSLFFKRHTGFSPQEYRKQATRHLLELPAKESADEPKS
jgi:AraC-like DNA-binding protein/mannose-6-phosphate isomerase-like protein (cupin superfamily)